MGDNQAILSQRFLESEGDLGRSFTRVLNKFGELQRSLTQRPAAASAQVDSTAALVATPAATPGADELYQQLQRDLATFEYALSHARTVQENAMQEMSNYERMEAQTAGQIEQTGASLVALQRDLDAAKQWRREQEEYEQLSEKLSALPSRAQTEADMARLAQEHAELQVAEAALHQRLRDKRSNHLLLTATFQTLREDWTRAERDESAASRAEREAARAAAEEEKRREEEEAAAMAEAAAAKADHNAEEAAGEAEEDNEEKKKQAAGLSSGGSGAIAEGDEAEEGAVPSTPPTAAAVAASEEGAPVGADTTGMQDADFSVVAAAGADSPASSPVPPAEGADAAAPMET